MANDEHLAILKKGVAAWNEWREKCPDPFTNQNLTDAAFKKAWELWCVDLKEANLDLADLSKANLKSVRLSRAALCKANLSQADLSNAHLRGANLTGAHPSRDAGP
jgi:uncharacterized protein YjbI with pentapeptide repeats